MGTFLLMNLALLIGCKRGFDNIMIWAAYQLTHSEHSVISATFPQNNEPTTRDSISSATWNLVLWSLNFKACTTGLWWGCRMQFGNVLSTYKIADCFRVDKPGYFLVIMLVLSPASRPSAPNSESFRIIGALYEFLIL